MPSGERGDRQNIADADRLSADAWRGEIDVNLTGAFLTVQPAILPMRERGSGRIVVISSARRPAACAACELLGGEGGPALGMVRTLALELAPSGVTVNAVLPGMVETENVLAMPARCASGRCPTCRCAASPSPTRCRTRGVPLLTGRLVHHGRLHSGGRAMSLTDLTLGRERQQGRRDPLHL